MRQPLNVTSLSVASANAMPVIRLSAIRVFCTRAALASRFARLQPFSSHWLSQSRSSTAPERSTFASLLALNETSFACRPGHESPLSSTSTKLASDSIEAPSSGASSVGSSGGSGGPAATGTAQAKQIGPARSLISRNLRVVNSKS